MDLKNAKALRFDEMSTRMPNWAKSLIKNMKNKNVYKNKSPIKVTCFLYRGSLSGNYLLRFRKVSIRAVAAVRSAM